MTKPNVFNYQNYVGAKRKIDDLEGLVIKLNLDNRFLQRRTTPKEASIKERKFWMQEYHEWMYDYEVRCPECDMFVCYTTEHDAHRNYQYCPRCGQRIEWKDVDEKD